MRCIDCLWCIESAHICYPPTRGNLDIQYELTKWQMYIECQCDIFKNKNQKPLDKW